MFISGCTRFTITMHACCFRLHPLNSCSLRFNYFQVLFQAAMHFFYRTDVKVQTEIAYFAALYFLCRKIKDI